MSEMMPNLYAVAMDNLDTPSRLSAESFCDLYEHVMSKYDDFVRQSDMITELHDLIFVHGHDHATIMGWFDMLVADRKMRVDAFVRTIEANTPVRFGDLVPLLSGENRAEINDMLPTPEDWADFQARVIADPCPARLRGWLGDRCYGRPLRELDRPHHRAVARMCYRFGCVPKTIKGDTIRLVRAEKFQKETGGKP